jgi:hypothetical protein
LPSSRGAHPGTGARHARLVGARRGECPLTVRIARLDATATRALRRARGAHPRARPGHASLTRARRRRAPLPGRVAGLDSATRALRRTGDAHARAHAIDASVPCASRQVLPGARRVAELNDEAVALVGAGRATLRAVTAAAGARAGSSVRPGSAGVTGLRDVPVALLGARHARAGARAVRTEERARLESLRRDEVHAALGAVLLRAKGRTGRLAHAVRQDRLARARVARARVAVVVPGASSVRPPSAALANELSLLRVPGARLRAVGGTSRPEHGRAVARARVTGWRDDARVASRSSADVLLGTTARVRVEIRRHAPHAPDTDEPGDPQAKRSHHVTYL